MGKVARPTAWLGLDNNWCAKVQRPSNPTPNYTLPDGRLLAVDNKQLGVDNSQIFGRGGVNGVVWGVGGNNTTNVSWTHTSMLQSTGKQPSWGIDESDWGMSFITEEDMIFVAHQVDLAVAEADHWQEGQYACKAGSTKPRWYYKERRKMHDQAGRPYRSVGSYGSFDIFNVQRWEYLTGGTPIAPNTSSFKARLQSVSNARASCTWFSLYGDGLTLQGTNIKSYMDKPDWATQFYAKMYAMEVMSLGMGNSGGIGPGFAVYLDWGKFEPLGNPYAFGFGNHEIRIANPPGKLVETERHAHMDYHLQVAWIFSIGLCIGKGYLMFNEPGANGTNRNQFSTWNTRWYPDVPGTQLPDYPVDHYPNEPESWLNAPYEAAYYYHMCERTAGTAWHYAAYDLPDISYSVSVTSDGTDILEHAAAFAGPYDETEGARRGRPVVMYRTKGGAIDFWIHDPSRAKDTYEKMIIHIPGKDFTLNEVRGSVIEVYNENF